MECFLTRRGKRVAERSAAWMGWVSGVALLLASVIAAADPVRTIGLAVIIGAATWTVVLAIRSNNEVVRAAFEMGREHERDAEVRQIH